jgi:hypothetical protein
MSCSDAAFTVECAQRVSHTNNITAFKSTAITLNVEFAATAATTLLEVTTCPWIEKFAFLSFAFLSFAHLLLRKVSI